MTEQLNQHNFVIEPATEADNAGIGQAHLASWHLTYPNAELGVTSEWIDETFGFLAEQKGIDFRANTIVEAHEHPDKILYLAVKDKHDKVVGFLHATRDNDQSTLEAIYLTQDAIGSGVADDLMNRALVFVGDLPMALTVAEYNDRAIHFYEKYGFEKDPDWSIIYRGKIPIISMKRQPKREAVA